MGASVYDFDPTDASNTAFAGITQAENSMKPSDVNNDFRAKDGAFARWIDDLGGVVTVAGTGDAVTVTIAESFTALATGQLFGWKAGAANTGAATVQITNSLASVLGTPKIRKKGDTALAANDMIANGFYLFRYDAAYDSANGAMVLLNPESGASAATTSAAGIVELATLTEAATLTDTSRAITADGLVFLGGYTTTATAAGTTTLTVTSTYHQYFTGTTTQTLVLPVTSTLVLGRSYRVINNSTGAVTVQSSGANTILVLAPGMTAIFTCILTSGTTAASWDYRPSLVLGTTVASTSGTAIDFTGFPAWTKRITISLSDVSTNGTTGVCVQLGDAGGIETSGYLNGTTNGAQSSTDLPIVGGTSSSAAGVFHGIVVLTLLDPATFTWAMSGVVGRSDTAAAFPVGGSKPLSDVLTQIRIKGGNGTDAFDAGKINVMYEG